MGRSCCPVVQSWPMSWSRRDTRGCGRTWAWRSRRQSEAACRGEDVTDMSRIVEPKAEALDVERIRKDFPILERTAHGKPLVYLDSANTSQKPRQVIDALTDYYERHNANLYRAVYELAEEATVAFEEARARLARFIGAPDPSCIVFNRGTTESVNLVAHGFGRKFVREGDEILVSEVEHHSNIVPWQFCAQVTGARLRYIPLGDDGMLGPTASGGLYGKGELLERMDPFLGGGEMIMEVYPDHSTLKDPPHKFEAGTMNIAQ